MCCHLNELAVSGKKEHSDNSGSGSVNEQVSLHLQDCIDMQVDEGEVIGKLLQIGAKQCPQGLSVAHR